MKSRTILICEKKYIKFYVDLRQTEEKCFFLLRLNWVGYHNNCFFFRGCLFSLRNGLLETSAQRFNKLFCNNVPLKFCLIKWEKNGVWLSHKCEPSWCLSGVGSVVTGSLGGPWYLNVVVNRWQVSVISNLKRRAGLLYLMLLFSHNFFH